MEKETRHLVGVKPEAKAGCFIVDVGSQRTTGHQPRTTLRHPHITKWNAYYYSITPMLPETMLIKVKRVYDEPHETDGYRVLVDRLWPRGVSKEALQHDEWLREIAPSDALRKEFNHDPGKFNDFKDQYYAELDQQPELADALLEKARSGHTLTLLYSAKDTKHNNAVVLKEYLEEKLG